MSKYEIYRLDDNYYFPSNDIIFNPYGVWINDNLNPHERDEDTTLFIPYTNIRQIIKNKVEGKINEN